MKLYHWWPGREWAGPCPIPMYLVKEAERMGSKYLTVAKLHIPGFDDESYVVGTAYCRKTDTPTRKQGREKAIEKLRDQCDMWFPGIEV